MAADDPPVDQSATGAAQAGPILRTKLWPPNPRVGLVSRARLDAQLQVGVRSKLCLVDAPAGFGKTTQLAVWCAGSDVRGRVAWVSLDEGDNDPVRFWTYVIVALRDIGADVGGVLGPLHGPGADLRNTVVPLLLNELSAADMDLVLVLDDYHLVTNSECHRALAFFLEYLPANVHVVLSTRADPPLPLARMRASGELVEIRAADLRFTNDEASELLSASAGFPVTGDDADRLTERTEGWAVGLHLAGLSLRRKDDVSGLIASFRGDHRHVADYLGAELLALQPDETRNFLLRTSILDRLSGPLCDAVLQTEGSAEVLRRLERSNLFLVALDDRRRWYRYHHLFAELLRRELTDRDPALLSALHQRAADWHQARGHVDEAVRHATAAGNVTQAGAMIAQHWLTFVRRGQQVTVTRWIEALPEDAVAADPLVAVSAAGVSALGGGSLHDVERWLALAEGGTWEGPLPDGSSSLAFAVAYLRAIFVFDDVGRAMRAARRAAELAGPAPSMSAWIAVIALAHTLFLAGQGPTMRPQLETLVAAVAVADQPYVVINALALLSLYSGDAGEALAVAQRAVETADSQRLSRSPICGLARVALGRALLCNGWLTEAEETLERAVDVLGHPCSVLDRAVALLVLAYARRERGDAAGADVALAQARGLIGEARDPGVLPALLDQVEQARTLPSRRRESAAAEALTERELAVLRLLPTRLSLREIGRELYVSVNTVRTHAHAVYRKLGVTSRAEALARARELGLLPGSAPADSPGSHPDEFADG